MHTKLVRMGMKCPDLFHSTLFVFAWNTKENHQKLLVLQPRLEPNTSQ